MELKLSVFLIAVLVAACSQSAPSGSEEQAFNAEAYRLDTYSARVRTFLESRKETEGKTDYNAVFVNTKGCSGCIRGAFESISPFLLHVDVPTFIFANDSSLLDAVPENEQLQFICLPDEVFHRNAIFHTRMYLYTVRRDVFSTVLLNPEQVDSLNAVSVETVND